MFLVSPNPAREGDVAHLQASSVLLVDLLLARRHIEFGHYLRSEHTKRMPSLSPRSLGPLLFRSPRSPATDRLNAITPSRAEPRHRPGCAQTFSEFFRSAPRMPENCRTAPRIAEFFRTALTGSECFRECPRISKTRMARCVMWAYIRLRRGPITPSLLAFGSTETGAIAIYPRSALE